MRRQFGKIEKPFLYFIIEEEDQIWDRYFDAWGLEVKDFRDQELTLTWRVLVGDRAMVKWYPTNYRPRDLRNCAVEWELGWNYNGTGSGSSESLNNQCEL